MRFMIVVKATKDTEAGKMPEGRRSCLPQWRRTTRN